MADEPEETDAPEYVTLIDRTGGPGEFRCGGRAWTFTKQKPTRVVPLHIAVWLMAEHRNRVWTAEGDFVRRFAIQDGPDSLLSELGESAFDTSPITLDTHRAEGWDSREADRPDARTIPLKRQPGDFANQGGAMAGTFSGKDR